MEVYTGYSGHSSDTVNHRAKRMGATRGRPEVAVPSAHHRPQKNAIRVCGDWSEQLSSKGKIYFYNCITEVSQWQKPPEWKLPDMNHDELLRLLSSREQSDGRSIKRSRFSTSVTTNIKDDSHLSPKRSKLSAECRDKNATISRRVSPSTLMNSTGCSDPSKLSGPRVQTNSHYSPKRNHDRRVYQNLPPQRPVPSNGPMKMHPVDDMDISPNSSPMSGCSGSSRSATTNQSPNTSRHLKYDPNRNHPTRNAIRNNEVFPHESSREEKPGALRQFVDAIRASIDGLLGQPTLTSRAHEQGPHRKTSLDDVAHSTYPFTRNETLSATDKPHRNSPRDVNDRHKFGYHTWSPKPRSCDSSAFFTTQSDGNRSISHPSPLSTCNSQTSSRLDARAKDVPGLVSTLTTLVSLIGSTKYQSTSTSTATSTPSSNFLLSTPHIPGQRTPSSHPLSVPQRRYSAVSPAMPSPLTPTLTNNASGTATALAQSLLESNLPTQQVNHILSSLESLAQQARYKSERPPLLEHPPQTSQSGRFDPIRGAYSDQGKNSPCHLLQNCTPNAPHPKQLNEVSSSSHYVGDDRFLGSPALSGSQRHFSGSHDDDRFRRTPSRPEGLHDPPSRDPQPGPSTSSLPSSSSCVPVSTVIGSTAPHLNRPVDLPYSSPDEKPPEDECLSKITRILGSPTTQSFVDPTTIGKFTDKVLDRLEQEALVESRKFEKLQSVLYGELSVESKKLRALVRISEAKLAIHREKQTSLQELMDAIESRRQLPNLSFADDVI